MKKVKLVHYGKQPQTLAEFPTDEEARRYCNQQAEILKGYYRRTGWVHGRFVVFGKYDIFKTQLWVE